MKGLLGRGKGGVGDYLGGGTTWVREGYSVECFVSVFSGIKQNISHRPTQNYHLNICITSSNAVLAYTT